MAHFEKHFTLDQANALLPWVRSIFAQVHWLLAQVADEAKSAFPAPAPGKTNGHGNGHGGPAHQPTAAHLACAGLARGEKIELVNRLLQALLEEGLVVQDVKRGLVDFPAWHEGEEVLLCYELNDGERIVAWHALHAGYAGRQPIEDFNDQ